MSTMPRRVPSSYAPRTMRVSEADKQAYGRALEKLDGRAMAALCRRAPPLAREVVDEISVWGVASPSASYRSKSIAFTLALAPLVLASRNEGAIQAVLLAAKRRKLKALHDRA